eukprot:Rmarinus@m.10804
MPGMVSFSKERFGLELSSHSTLESYLRPLAFGTSRMWSAKVKKTYPINGNEYCITRPDGYVINGKGWEEHRRKYMSRHRFQNPFAIGQFANHPEHGSHPNIISVSLDLPESTGSDLLRFFPNVFTSKDPDRACTCLKGLVFVSARDIEDEEIFLNYRLAGIGLPGWYHGTVSDDSLVDLYVPKNREAS